ncbi:methylated-DNA--[protein]-cysteine S-methyltransferase [Demequina sp. NBRC 110057]|uniref:methylated-DNA--[protein]-cysteine S-methyltransferase n=1 Tax=Demequina sp. NBRC 110057 TaxID=1570346 RepID=UPI0009FC2532|nr:methylated-DNA--[protein]-cysteine S-methyltransferase [Demequina sp. NBRC 110057]
MTSPLLAASYATPFGDLAVVAESDGGVIRAADFRPVAQVARQVGQAHASRGWVEGVIPQAADAVAAWLEGDDDALMTVAVEQDGGPFFQEVWAQMRTVPAGRAVSYGELAEMAGRPRASRAVGTACASNSVALFVPCHRVVQAGGRLGSYGFGGIENKAALLRHEGVKVSDATPSARLIERAS